MKKDELIQRAYEAEGVDWEKVKQFITIDGWIDYIKAREFISEKDNELKFERSMHKYALASYRPKSLAGIENNHGWIKIESEADLPETKTECFVITDAGKEYTCIYNRVYKEFVRGSLCIPYSQVTHYQPIVKPNKPLY